MALFRIDMDNQLFAGGQAPQGGGLLGMMAGGQPPQATPQSQQGGADPKQMAMMLAQSPTPDTVQKVIAQIRASNVPDGDKWIQVLTQYANDPKTLAMISQEVMKTAGGNAQ
jgi:hypothetical protein